MIQKLNKRTSNYFSKSWTYESSGFLFKKTYDYIAKKQVLVNSLILKNLVTSKGNVV